LESDSEQFEVPDASVDLNSGGFSFENVTESDVVLACSEIHSNAIGLDGIPIKFIKIVLSFILPFLTFLINSCLTQSIFPSQWKRARVLPIPKVKIPKRLNDIRPISILPCLSKILEKLINLQILKHLNKFKLMSPLQSGFKIAHSTTTALLKITDDITAAFERGEVTVLVLIDFSRAFDSISHNILLNKLKYNFKFSKSACSLMKSFLNDRYQKVVIDGRESEDLNIKMGVPQGSILGPLLFSMYLNDLCELLDGLGYHFYADDLQIYLSCLPKDINSCIAKINAFLEKISLWSTMNSLSVNVDKCHAICLTDLRSFSTNNVAPVVFNSKVIPFEANVKNLGVWFDSRLSWNKHVNITCSSVYSMLAILWANTKYLSTETRRKLIVSLILPKLIYCAPLFGGCGKMVWNKLNRAFNSCARYIYRKRRSDRISSFTYKILNCTLKCFFSLLQCKFLFNMIHSMVPKYLYEKLTISRSQRTGGLVLPSFRRKTRNQSFFVHGVQLYNSLCNETRNSATIGAFKNRCFHELKERW